MNLKYSELLKKIQNYVLTSDEISCLALIGSQSGSDNLADEFSDIDLLLVTSNRIKYFESSDWLREIEEMWVSFTESDSSANFWERRAIFKDGLDVDFIIIDESQLMEDIDSMPIVKDICNKEVNVIIDKINATSKLHQLRTLPRVFTFPTDNEFNNLVNDFYFHFLWAYKKIMRGEYWIALRCINSYLQSRLLTMLEWHEHALHGVNYQTYYDGRFLEKWVDQGVLDRFKGTFSTYDQAAMESALKNLVVLFTEKAKDLCNQKNYFYPCEGVEKLTEWIEKNFICFKVLDP